VHYGTASDTLAIQVQKTHLLVIRRFGRCDVDVTEANSVTILMSQPGLENYFTVCEALIQVPKRRKG
jgi:hypothetical protein